MTHWSSCTSGRSLSFCIVSCCKLLVFLCEHGSSSPQWALSLVPRRKLPKCQIYLRVCRIYIYIYTHDDSSPSSHFICCFSLSLTQRTRAQLLRVLGRQRSLDKFLLWEGILGARWLPHLGEARMMKDGSCDDERGASFREAGAGSSLIPSTSIQIPFVWISCHLASRDFAARCSLPPPFKVRANPPLDPSTCSEVF